jgi:hypothetical protein
MAHTPLPLSFAAGSNSRQGPEFHWDGPRSRPCASVAMHGNRRMQNRSAACSVGLDLPDRRPDCGRARIWWHCRIRGGDRQDHLFRRDHPVRDLRLGARAYADRSLGTLTAPETAHRHAKRNARPRPGVSFRTSNNGKTSSPSGRAEDGAGRLVRPEIVGAVDREKLCQARACAVDAALDGTDRTVADRGSLLVGES